MLDLGFDEVLQTYTTSELVEKVKRVVVGPKTWSPIYQSPPKLQRELVVRFKEAVDELTWTYLRPGGRYFALHFQPPILSSMGLSAVQHLTIWEAATGRCIWRRSSGVSEVSFDLRDGGEMLFIILVLRDPPKWVSRRRRGES
jgi:hypothetical protein